MADDNDRKYEAGVFREKWRHEDALINHRLTWLLASQTLLLGAYGLLCQRLTDWFFCPTPDQLHHLASLLRAIPWVGLLTSASLFVGVGAAFIAMRVIRDRASKDTTSSPEVYSKTTFAGWAAGGVLPIIFCGAWLWIMISQCRTQVVVNAMKTATVVCNPEKLKQENKSQSQPVTVTCTTEPSAVTASAAQPKARHSLGGKSESGGTKVATHRHGGVSQP